MTLVTNVGNRFNFYSATGELVSVDLPRRHAPLLQALADAHGSVVPFAKLYQATKGTERPPQIGGADQPWMKALANWVFATRGFLKPVTNFLGVCIETVPASGYRLAPDIEPDHADAQRAAKRFSEQANGREELLLEVIQKILAGHLGGDVEGARRQGRVFSSAVSQSDLVAVSNAELPRLLLIGLPVHPDHRMGSNLSGDHISAIRTDTLFCQRLCAARLTEISYEAAHEYVNVVAKSRGPEAACAKFEYIHAQVARKLGELAGAAGCYDRAERSIEKWDQDLCRCGGSCRRPDLLLNIARGRAVLHRAEGNFSLAVESFEHGASLAGDASPDDQAEFFYSYGYFEFERVFKSQDCIRPGPVEKAERLLQTAATAKEHWSAPILRIGILQLATNNHGAIQTLSKALQVARRECGAEAELVEVNAGFAIAALEQRADVAEKAFERLTHAFTSIPIPPATRECHGFDNEVICKFLDSARLIRNGQIASVLQVARTWTATSLSAQSDLFRTAISNTRFEQV